MRPVIPPFYAVFDNLAESLCPLCTSAYQYGCSKLRCSHLDQSLAAVYGGDVRGGRQAGRETRREKEVNVAKEAEQPGDDTCLTRSSVPCGWPRRPGQ